MWRKYPGTVEKGRVYTANKLHSRFLPIPFQGVAAVPFAKLIWQLSMQVESGTCTSEGWSTATIEKKTWQITSRTWRTRSRWCSLCRVLLGFLRVHNLFKLHLSELEKSLTVSLDPPFLCVHTLRRLACARFHAERARTWPESSRKSSSLRGGGTWKGQTRWKPQRGKK